MAIQFTVRFVCVCVNILCNMLLIKHRYYLVLILEVHVCDHLQYLTIEQ